MKKLATLIVLLILSFHAIAINPSREYQVKPEQLGMKYLTEKITVNATTKLNSWIFLQDNRNKPFIIISNPDAGNMSNSLGQTGAFFKAGYNVIMYDYRGFGESSDFKIDREMMYYEEFTEDLRTVLQFVRKTYKPKQVVLYGMSMGTIISKSVLNNDTSISGAIFDSFVLDPNLIVERIRQIKNKEVLLPEGVEKYVESNRKSILIPILLFSGLKDIVTKSTDYTAFLGLNKKSRLITWDCNHLECFYKMTKGTDGDLYISEVNTYIKSLI